jgi:PAS domain S-box-containing protein
LLPVVYSLYPAWRLADMIGNTGESAHQRAARMALRTALIYALLGCLWIILSDRALSLIAFSPEWALAMQIYKGWAFIFATATLLYLGCLYQFGRLATESENRLAAEQRLLRLNRVYAVLSNVNQAIVRVREPEKLIEVACRIASGHGGILAASIVLSGRRNGNAGLIVRPGQNGAEVVPVEALPQEGPAAVALRSANHLVAEVPPEKADASAWCREARAMGCTTIAAFPLVSSTKTWGVLTLYASDPHVFDEDALRLFDELALDLAFAFEFVEQDQLREQAETALYVSELRHRETLEAMIEGFQVIGFDWRYLYVNDAAVVQNRKPREELIGRTMQEAYPGIENAHIFPVLKRCMEERVPEIVETLFTFPDGVQGWFVVSVKPVPEGISILSLDITAHKQLEHQFQHAQKMESIARLAGGIAHDFNNILGVIIGYSDLALAALPQEHPVRSDIREIRLAGDRATALTRQLLAFSRKQVLHPVLLSLNDVVAECENMLRRLLGEDVELKVALAPDLGRVLADKSQIEQVLLNLAVNARDAMPRGGTLCISTQNLEVDEEYAREFEMIRPGHYVQLTVSDTGVGMDQETRSRIFEPFYTTKEQGKGTGLGLSTVYGIVKQSGGSVWVYSEPDQGTVFKILLPCVSEDTRQGATEPLSAAAVGGSESILLVEDEESLRTLTERILKDAGYAVLTAGGPQEAMDVLAKTHAGIDMVLSDVVMPGGNGAALVASLREKRPGLRALFMSGYADEIIALNGLLNHGAHFIGKPFTASQLLRKVRAVLDAPPPTPPEA